MTKQLLKRLSLLIVVALSAVACSPNTEYANVLPDKVDVVLSLDFASLAKKADLSSAENKELLDGFVATLKQKGAPEEVLAWVDKLRSNPQAMGVDFEQPLYAFMGIKHLDFGLVARIKDQSKVAEFATDMVRSHNIKVEEHEQGLKTMTFCANAILAFNSKSLLLLSGHEAQHINLERVKQLFAQKAEQSFAGSNAFKSLAAGSGDIRFWGNFSAIMASLKDDNSQLAAHPSLKGLKDFPSIFNHPLYKDLSFIARLSFEAGKIVSSIEPQTDNAETLKFIKGQSEDYLKVGGTFLKSVAKNAFFVWNMSADMGASFSKSMAQIPQLKMILEPVKAMGYDLEAIASSIKGDMTVYFNDVNMANKTIDFGIYCQLSQPEPIAQALATAAQEIVLHNQRMDSLDRVSPRYYAWSDGKVAHKRNHLPELKSTATPGVYSCEIVSDMELLVGVKDKVFYILPASVPLMKEQKESILNSSYSSAINKYPSYCLINFEAILKHPMVAAGLSFAPDPIRSAAEELKSLETYHDKDKNMGFAELSLVTSKENSLKLIVDLLRDL